MYIDILKCHGSGNDFILIDEYNNDYNLTDEARVTLTRTLCNRKSSIGADGILFYEKSSCADAAMRIFNSDGSEAKMCGNGIRCLGRYAVETLNKDNVRIQVMEEVLNLRKVEEIYENVKTFEVEIRPVSFDVDDMPMNYSKPYLKNEVVKELSEDIKFTGLSVPNPHIVAIVEDIDEAAIETMGKFANGVNNVFPEGVNLNFVKVLGEQTIFVQTYERGVGFTNACGTGMSSASLVTCLNGINELGRAVTVFNKGGMVRCVPEIKDNGEYYIKLIGNATYVFSGVVDFDFNAPQKFELTNVKEFNEDAKSYEKMAQYAKSRCI